MGLLSIKLVPRSHGQPHHELGFGVLLVYDFPRLIGGGERDTLEVHLLLELLPVGEPLSVILLGGTPPGSDVTPLDALVRRGHDVKETSHFVGYPEDPPGSLGGLGGVPHERDVDALDVDEDGSAPVLVEFLDVLRDLRDRCVVEVEHRTGVWWDVGESMTREKVVEELVLWRGLVKQDIDLYFQGAHSTVELVETGLYDVWLGRTGVHEQVLDRFGCHGPLHGLGIR